MRFNAKELAHVAQEKSSYFDFESILFVKERPEGIFKKSKAFTERLFRLKGNILFYFKGKDKSCDVAGLYVLERCCVQLEEDEIDDIHLYCFSIVFEGEPSLKQAYLGSTDEHTRDRWIELLHIASFECMKFQLDILRDQIKSKTGKDPILQMHENCLAIDSANNDESIQDVNEGTVLEMGIHCKGLPLDQHGKYPDTFATLHYFCATSKHQWVFHGRTEIIEKNISPNFVSIITFRNFETIALKTKLKISLRVIKERLTNTAVTIGIAEFSLMEILTSPTMSASFTLRSSKYDEVGSVILSLWMNSNSSNKQGGPRTFANDMDLIFNKSKLLEGLQTQNQLQSMNPCCLGVDHLFLTGRIIKTFRFPIGNDANSGMLVNEHMAEFKHAFLIPYYFLKMLVEDEKQKILSLRNLGKLRDKFEATRSSLIDFHLSSVVSHEQQMKFYFNKKDLSFKPSIKKSHKEVELVPTNLHLHSMYVSGNILDECCRYDVITVGAFTAGALKYKHGGVRKLANQLEVALAKGDKSATRMEDCTKLLRLLKGLREEIFMRCDALCSCAVKGRIEPVKEAFKILDQRVNKLLRKCEDKALVTGVVELCSAQFNGTEGSIHSFDSLEDEDSDDDLDTADGEGVIEGWMWNGTDYIKGGNEEPFDLVRLNTEAALVSLRSKLQELFQQPENEAVSWLDSISSQIITLRKSVEMLVERSTKGLNFVIMQDVGPNLPLYHSLKGRKDIVFCQAITTAIAGFLSKLSSQMTSLFAFRQHLSSSSSSSSSSLSSSHLAQKLKPGTSPHRHRSMTSSSSSSLLSIPSSSHHSFFSRALAVYARIGVLMQFESLLSCYGDEMCMLEDHSEAIADLMKVKIRLKSKSSATKTGHKGAESNFPDFSCSTSQDVNFTPSNEAGSSQFVPPSTSSVDSRPARGSEQAPPTDSIDYRIEGGRDGCEVVIFLPPNVFEDVRMMCQNKNDTSKVRESFAFQIIPVMFTIGINEQATLAERFFSIELQEELNRDNFQLLNNYYKDFCSLPDNLKGTDMKGLNSAMQSLNQNVQVIKKSKNVDVLHQAADICRRMGGVRYSSCKSAKDRTAMSVTLEEVTLLKKEHNLSSDLQSHALDALRSEGVRRDNTYKNTGVRKYAFNTIQLLSIPKQYRPPKGTFGNLET